MKKKVVLLILMLMCQSGCVFADDANSPASPQTHKTTVILIGTIHGWHYKNPHYSPSVLQDIILSLKPDVVVVTADHSTPAVFKGHSWHPIPFLLSSKWCRPDGVLEFSESACRRGALGRFPATEIMPLAMANALKLNKYGA